MTDGTNPFLITPPPGLLPPVPQKQKPAPEPEDTQVPSITLPGIISDSSTVRVNPVREPVTARPPGLGGIPFSTPGATPATAPQQPVVGVVPATSPAVEPAVDNDETRIVPPRAQTAPSWRLMFPDGASITVDGAIYLGRNPTRTDADREGALLPLADETKSVSKTHAVVSVESSGLWVTDLDSTNGVYVAHADGTGEQAEPGEPLPIPPGSDLVLGEYVIQVELG